MSIDTTSRQSSGGGGGIRRIFFMLSGKTQALKKMRTQNQPIPKSEIDSAKAALQKLKTDMENITPDEQELIATMEAEIQFAES